jgi:hypothetical protein
VTVTQTKTWTGRAVIDPRGKIHFSLHLTSNKLTNGSKFGKLIPNQVVVPPLECDLTTSGFLRPIRTDVEHPNADDGRTFRFEKTEDTPRSDLTLEKPRITNPQYDRTLPVTDPACGGILSTVRNALATNDFPMTFTAAGELQIRFASEPRAVTPVVDLGWCRDDFGIPRTGLLGDGTAVTLVLKKAVPTPVQRVAQSTAK